MQTRTIELDDLLSMICCLDTYGLNKPIMRDFLKEAVGEISPEDIEAYCRRAYLSPEAIKQGYGMEDYEDGMKTLGEFFS